MTRPWNPRRVDELPDDDGMAIYRLTGGDHGGTDIQERRSKMWPKRNCSPWMKKDPEMTRRFQEAVIRHQPDEDRTARVNESIKQEIDRLLDEGKIASFSDIPESLLTRACLAQIADGRRPTAINKAIELAAKIKGLIGERPVGSGTEALDQLLDELEVRRTRRGRGPRPLEDADDAATG